jgi:hypothetical protein
MSNDNTRALRREPPIENWIYDNIGCSQDSHLADCMHYGWSGTYLSGHTPWCDLNGKNRGPCICNPAVRARRSRVFLYDEANSPLEA